jgi:hypothetical protein
VSQGADVTTAWPKEVTLVQRNHNAGFFSNLNAAVTVLARRLGRDGVTAVEIEWHAREKATHFPYGLPEEGNLWPSFFEPLPFTNVPEWRVEHRGSADRRITGRAAYATYKLLPYWRPRYGDIYRRYVRPRSHLVERVDRLMARVADGSFCLGIHYRNPRHSVECLFPIPPPETFVAHARRMFPKGRPHAVLLATDTDEAIPVFRAAFGDALVIQDEARRSAEKGGDQVHHENPNPGRDLGEQVLIDCLLLARSDALLHVTSNLATAAGFINPHMPMIYCETRFEAVAGYAWSLGRAVGSEFVYAWDKRLVAPVPKLRGRRP